jgi:hypothetical protein
VQLSTIEASRQQLLNELGFDIYCSPKFIEHLVCKLCGLQQTAKQNPYDGLHPTGFKVEIKHSVVCQYTPSAKLVNGKILTARTHSFFAFTALQGTHRKGKEADVYVLVGSTHNGLRFFVLSLDDLIKKDGVGLRNRVDISLDEKRYQNTGKWLKHEVPIAELQYAVTQVGTLQMLRLRPDSE